MPEGPPINPEEYAHEKGDFTDVHNKEFQDELREAGEKAIEDKEFEFTPEMEEKIMAKVQDIQEYQGFIIRTQFPSVPSILTNGIRPTRDGLSAKDAPRWGTQGTLIGKRHGSFQSGIYFSSAGPSANFDEWKYIAWEEAGQIVLLLDDKQMFEKEMTQILEEPDGYDGISAYEERDYISSNVDLGTFRLDVDEEIEPSAIKGAVVSPEDCKLTRRADKWGHTKESIIITSEQAQKLLTSRLSKRLKKEPNSYNVPIYNNHGDLLWPRQMKYEEVKQFVTEREAKKQEEATPENEDQELQP